MSMRIFISAGEPSGDIHASALVKALKSYLPEAEFFGMGGALMRREGVRLIHSFEDKSVIGFLEAVTEYKRLRNTMADLVNAARHADIAIMVDYPGFNLQMARHIKNYGVNTVYYIVPQVWAWGKWRVRALKKYIDLALVILPFEEPLLRNYGIDAHFVGHPIVDMIEADTETIDIEHGRRWTVGFLPGSRPDEIRRLLPRMLEVKRELRKLLGDDVFFLLSLVDDKFLTDEIANDREIAVFKGRARGIMRASDMVLLASGTASLEAGLLGVPMVVLYMLSDVSWLIAKMIARVKYTSLVNILLGDEVVPEFIQHVHPDEIARFMAEMLTDDSRKSEMMEQLKRLKKLLYRRNAADRAARHIIKKFIENKPS